MDIIKTGQKREKYNCLKSQKLQIEFVFKISNALRKENIIEVSIIQLGSYMYLRNTIRNP